MKILTNGGGAHHAHDLYLNSGSLDSRVELRCFMAALNKRDMFEERRRVVESLREFGEPPRPLRRGTFTTYLSHTFPRL